MPQGNSAPQGNQGNSQSRYTNCDCTTLFNNNSGALTLGFSSAGFGKSYGTIKLSEVFAEMRGKTPGKGETVYDHDNALFVSIGAEDLQRLGLGLMRFKEESLSDPSKKVIDFEIPLNKMSLRIVDGSLVGDPLFTKGVMLYLRKAEEEVAHAFFFEEKELSLYGVPEDKEPVETHIINTSFEVFKTWVSEIAKSVVSPIDYTRLALRGQSGQANRPAGGSYTAPGAPSRRSSTAAPSGRAATAPATDAGTWADAGDGPEMPPF